MQLFDPNNPNERKKMIAAAALFVVAIAVLGYVFFGGSSTKPPTNSTAAKPSPTPNRVAAKEPEPVDDLHGHERIEEIVDAARMQIQLTSQLRAGDAPIGERGEHAELDGG